MLQRRWKPDLAIKLIDVPKQRDKLETVSILTPPTGRKSPACGSVRCWEPSAWREITSGQHGLSLPRAALPVSTIEALRMFSSRTVSWYKLKYNLS